MVEGHERVSDTDAEQTRVRDDYSRALHRLESFKELDERRAHYSLAVQEAFSANQKQHFQLIGTLADAIQVDREWEHAGRRSLWIVAAVDSGADAGRCHSGSDLAEEQ